MTGGFIVVLCFCSIHMISSHAVTQKPKCYGKDCIRPQRKIAYKQLINHPTRQISVYPTLLRLKKQILIRENVVVSTSMNSVSFTPRSTFFARTSVSILHDYKKEFAVYKLSRRVGIFKRKRECFVRRFGHQHHSNITTFETVMDKLFDRKLIGQEGTAKFLKSNTAKLKKMVEFRGASQIYNVDLSAKKKCVKRTIVGPKISAYCQNLPIYWLPGRGEKVPNPKFTAKTRQGMRMARNGGVPCYDAYVEIIMCEHADMYSCIEVFPIGHNSEYCLCFFVDVYNL